MNCRSLWLRSLISLRWRDQESFCTGWLLPVVLTAATAHLSLVTRDPGVYWDMTHVIENGLGTCMYIHGTTSAIWSLSVICFLEWPKRGLVGVFLPMWQSFMDFPGSPELTQNRCCGPLKSRYAVVVEDPNCLRWEEQSNTRAAKAESWVPAAGKITTSCRYLLFREDASSLCTKRWPTRAVGPCSSGCCCATSVGRGFQLHFRRALPQPRHLVVPEHVLAGGKLPCL